MRYDDSLPKIDPTLIPNCEWDRICSELDKSIRAALSDPVLRAEYDEWKRQHSDR